MGFKTYRVGSPHKFRRSYIGYKITVYIERYNKVYNRGVMKLYY